MLNYEALNQAFDISVSEVSCRPQTSVTFSVSQRSNQLCKAC